MLANFSKYHFEVSVHSSGSMTSPSLLGRNMDKKVKDVLLSLLLKGTVTPHPTPKKRPTQMLTLKKGDLRSDLMGHFVTCIKIEHNYVDFLINWKVNCM